MWVRVTAEKRDRLCSWLYIHYCCEMGVYGRINESGWVCNAGSGGLSRYFRYLQISFLNHRTRLSTNRSVWVIIGRVYANGTTFEIQQLWVREMGGVWEYFQECRSTASWSYPRLLGDRMTQMYAIGWLLHATIDHIIKEWPKIFYEDVLCLQKHTIMYIWDSVRRQPSNVRWRVATVGTRQLRINPTEHSPSRGTC